MKAIELLKMFQARKGLNDSRFARLLGVDRSALCRIYKGQCEPGLKVWRALFALFPEDEHMIATVLRAGTLDALR